MKTIMIMSGVLSLGLTLHAQDAALVKKGEGVYTAQRCSTCHGIAGKGNKSNPLDGVGGKLSTEDIHHWIVDPTAMTAKAQSTKKPPMPNRYSKLPAEELDALVAYLASLK
ncbi:MAG: cytochrome c [Acidobacteriaceae bacterium]|nr:cytochrome c [Acidobacteriaceae bacterium]